MEARSIPQKQLTSECWLIQFQGLKACETCPARGTPDCGGKNIRKKLMNELGYKVPLGTKIKLKKVT